MANPNPHADFPTTIGADASFKGELQFEKGVQLFGKFEGQIDTKGQLVVAEGATLTGEVKAGDIRVDGQVKGNLNAGSKIQLSASGRLEGDIQAARLEVAEGAVLIGRCVVGGNGHAPRDMKRPAGPAAAQPPAETPKPREGR